MLEPAFGCQQKPFRAEIFQNWPGACGHQLGRFHCVAALIDDANGKLPLEIPLVPKGQHVVIESAIFERDLIDARKCKGRGELVVLGEVDALSPRIPAAHVQSNLRIETFPSFIQGFGSPQRFLWKCSPRRLIELDKFATRAHDFA